MKKYLVILLAFLASMVLSGIAAAEEEVTVCGPECYANSIIQTDKQLIDNVETCPNVPIIFNEGISAAVTVTPADPYVEVAPDLFYKVGFSRTVQNMDQTISNIVNPGGLTANKAMQASWMENQGDKEFNPDALVDGGHQWDYEASKIRQNTVQLIDDVNFGQEQEDNPMAVFNADSKLAIISDNIDDLIVDTLSASSETSDTNGAAGSYSNNAVIDAYIRDYAEKMQS
jgi:hypothetical protein